MECKGCKKGISYCYHRPCWGLPEEFEKILDAGFSGLVQEDFYYQKGTGKGDISVLSGAIYQEVGAIDVKADEEENIFGAIALLIDMIATKSPEILMSKEYQKTHSGGKVAPLSPTGKCVMLTEDNLCRLHDLGLKPEEGREACCKVEEFHGRSHEEYANLWDTDYGRSVVEKWKSLNKTI